MAYTNRMTKLINKIEVRLGTRPLNLPEELSKENWAEIIKEQSLETFSRYFPHKLPYTVNQADIDKRTGKYIIDEKYISDAAKILGVRDLSWNQLTPGSSGINNQPYGFYDFYANTYSYDDFMLMQMRANELSLFNYGFFVEFEDPNKICVKDSTGNDVMANIPHFNVELLLVHADTLNTISPTKMESFEKLAQADVAVFLYENLKYYDGLETVFGSANLRLDDLMNKANAREEIMNIFEDTYISAGNDNQPLMYTI